MNAFSSRAIKAYASIGVETGVASASPHQLILMLYEGAISAVASAQAQLRLKDVAGKGQNISKAISIISDGLSAALEQNVGGDVARNLHDLYQYMAQRLLEANLKNDDSALEEVRQLLVQLKGAWESMPVLPKQSQLASGATASSAYGSQLRSSANSYGSI
jgi:flagellar protein FliS